MGKDSIHNLKVLDGNIFYKYELKQPEQSKSANGKSRKKVRKTRSKSKFSKNRSLLRSKSKKAKNKVRGKKKSESNQKVLKQNAVQQENPVSSHTQTKKKKRQKKKNLSIISEELSHKMDSDKTNSTIHKAEKKGRKLSIVANKPQKKIRKNSNKVVPLKYEQDDQKEVKKAGLMNKPGMNQLLDEYFE